MCVGHEATKSRRSSDTDASRPRAFVAILDAPPIGKPRQLRLRTFSRTSGSRRPVHDGAGGGTSAEDGADAAADAAAEHRIRQRKEGSALCLAGGCGAMRDRDE